eukprot:6078177-Pleurochrysis_carterae.AAC.1
MPFAFVALSALLAARAAPLSAAAARDASALNFYELLAPPHARSTSASSCDRACVREQRACQRDLATFPYVCQCGSMLNTSCCYVAGSTPPSEGCNCYGPRLISTIVRASTILLRDRGSGV